METEAVSDARRAAVDRAREGWIRRLMDLSRRNNLLYDRASGKGILDLSGGDGAALAAFLSGTEAVPFPRLLPGAAGIAPTVQEIRRRALSNQEEKGLSTMFLALGAASWTVSDGGRPPSAPVLLVPAAVEGKGRDGRALALRRTGEVQANRVLLAVLETAFGIRLEPETLIDPLQGDDEGERFDPAPSFLKLGQACASVPGFSVSPRISLSNYAFQKMAMVRDLKDNGEALLAHDLIAAVAGDASAMEAVRAGRRSLDPAELDRTPPEGEFAVLDADSTQQRVVAAAAALQDGVIQGPPGTGKSQTITNLIATLAAQGRRVLFVAEKRAALEVVLKRLEASGLGHLALDLHGAEISRREVLARFAESLSKVRESVPVDPSEIHRPFAERRERLLSHASRLHAPRPPSGLGVFVLQGRILGLPPEAKSVTRWRGADLERLTSEAAARVRDLLTEAGGFEGLFLRTDPSPWTGSAIPDGASARKAMDLVAGLAREPWDGILPAVSAVLADYRREFLDLDPEPLASALAPAGKSAPVRCLASLLNPAYRKARRTVLALRKSPAKDAELLAELRRPRPRALEDLRALSGFLGRDLLAEKDLPGLLKALAADTLTPTRLPRLSAIERGLAEAGALAFVEELRATRPPAARWGALFDAAWLPSCLDRARAEDPEIAAFDGRTHERFLAEFRDLDRRRLALASARVRRAHAERAVETMNARPEQTALVRREAEKKSRHLPVRSLMAQAPDVLLALRPCWMASPLSVSQLLPSDRRYFDVVLFDEASQVLPEDAVPSLMRAGKAVVAGDSRQLPPTPFFAAGQDEDAGADEAAPSEGFESLLDLMASFLDPWPLAWHYRSRDESLIAFSNRFIYGGSLVTFPGPGGPPVLSHVLAGGSPAEGQEESGDAEVARVVEIVLDHAGKRPGESLGVIAMGLPHARRVEAALDEALKERPELEPFFDPSRPERFFVKNLERVQGDERDAVILTVGYGKDKNGKLPYRFGPLLSAGGERRLNVAVTRARRRVTVVSSFTHLDMDPAKSKAQGVALLREYLAFAASGGRAATAPAAAGEADPFGQDLIRALQDQGLSVEPNWGASRLKVDLAVRDPGDPSRFVLAVEADGPGYLASPTVRDRDRLRPQVLEGLGWRHHRIWSVDWFLRREAEIARVKAACQASRASAPKAETAAPIAETAARPRPPCPVEPGRPVDAYTPRDLVALLRWIQSDGKLRTDDELAREAFEALGFKRHGGRVDEALSAAVRRWRKDESWAKKQAGGA